MGTADYPGMRCDMARYALSARLDDEPSPLPDDAVDEHVGACAACRDWLVTAQRITRTVRVQLVRVPDITARILAAAHDARALPSPEPHPSRWAVTSLRLRLALGALAGLQLVLAIPDLLGAVGHDAHAGREVAAFGVALAVGLLIAAAYPDQARAFAPVVATLVMCLATVSAIDVVQGVVSLERVAVHLIAAAQAGLLWLLARAVGPRSLTPR
jgi:predicted anti-sigma-YlaC factor YlaD